jgi:predicted transcriptional regulator of viral defense system
MIKRKNRSSTRDKAKQIIRQNGGIIKTSEALHAGIHPRTLYQLRDRGDIEQISRGIYRLTEIEPVSNPDFVVVATRIPNFCYLPYISAFLSRNNNTDSTRNFSCYTKRQ